jgi:hypothetical protein
MRNKYAELFKEITPQKWKEMCDEALTNQNLQKYFNIEIPLYIIRYYSQKFGYKCPLDSHSKDERGNRYGKLTVESFAGRNNKGEILWNCRCDCGNKEIRSGVILRDTVNEHISMCNDCCKKNMSQIKLDNLTGKTFNLLKVGPRIGSMPQSGLAIYECTCLNCGTKLKVNSGNLKNGQISCGCINSKGEYIIAKILQELNISFQKQYKINDCKNKIPLPFDFAIFDKDNKLCCLIEFQGKQHYNKVSGSWCDTDETFQNRLNRDNIKRTYCYNSSIPLIEIKYTELNKINQKYILNLLNPFLFDIK